MTVKGVLGLRDGVEVRKCQIHMRRRQEPCRPVSVAGTRSHRGDKECFLLRVVVRFCIECRGNCMEWSQRGHQQGPNVKIRPEVRSRKV